MKILISNILLQLSDNQNEIMNKNSEIYYDK